MTENQNNPIPTGLFEKTTEYFGNQVRLLKLNLIEKFSTISISLIIGLILLFLFIMVFLLLSVGLAEYISFKSGNSFSGFFWVGGGFFILLLGFLIGKSAFTKGIQNPIIKFLSHLFFDDESN